MSLPHRVNDMEPFDYDHIPRGPHIDLEEACHWVAAIIVAALTVWALSLVGR